jgi:hypothetical protein
MARVVKQHYEFSNRVRKYGPYGAGDSGIGARHPLTHFDKTTYLDQLGITAEVVSSANETIRFGFANAGQTMADAATAGNWLTDTINLRVQPTGDLLAADLIDSEDDSDIFNMADNPHEFGPGSRLFIQFSGTATALANLLITAALREAVQ